MNINKTNRTLEQFEFDTEKLNNNKYMQIALQKFQRANLNFIGFLFRPNYEQFI